MNRRTQPFNQIFVHNLLWLVASILLAFFVWLIASNASDPVQERRLPQQFPIQVLLDPNLVVVEQQTRNARVTVRAQSSVLTLLTTEDVSVQADMRGLAAGTHTVELEPRIARNVLRADTQPIQITVTVDEIQSQQVDIAPNIAAEPPTGFQRGNPSFSDVQVMATGPSRAVQRVVAAQATINLEDQRGTYEAIVPLVPVDTEGRPVEEVTLEPEQVTMTIEITLPQNVLEVPIVTNIDLDSLPEGYDLVSFTPDLRTVFVSGDISRIPDILETEPISLADRTEDFEVTAPIIAPPAGVFILGERQEVNVSVIIEPRIITRPFEDVPVIVSGVGDGLVAQIVTMQVTLSVTGPQAELQALDEDELRVTVDLTGLSAGRYDLPPVVYNGQVQMEGDHISVSPQTISVTIAPQPVPTPTT